MDVSSGQHAINYEVIDPVEREELITPEEIRREKSGDKYCSDVRKYVGLPGSVFKYDQVGFLVRVLPMERDVKIVAPVSLQY